MTTEDGVFGKDCRRAAESWDVTHSFVSWEAQSKRQPNLLCLTY